MEKEHEQHLVPYRLYLLVWAGLMGLTIVTVGAKYADLQHLAIFAAILIATVKASLVVLYFMHMRYEKRIIPIIILVALASFGVFLILTFTDYPFR